MIYVWANYHLRRLLIYSRLENAPIRLSYY